MFTLRFDMRAPANGAPATDLYRAAIEICAWAESRGCVNATLCEHHMSEDGYLPAPLILASAVASRTTSLPITVAIFQLPLYSPVQVAEQMCVLDIISGGRVSYVGGLGYLPWEYEMHGVDFHRRGKIADEHLALLLKAVTGEPFEYEGRKIHVTPPPVTPGGPRIGWGGGSLPAARRAGRFGINFLAQSGDPALRTAYEEACRENGHAPGLCMLPSRNIATTVFVAEDVDRAWAELGPYLMNDVLGYAAWNSGQTGDPEAANISFVKTAEELRKENRTHRILTPEEAVAWVRGGAPLPLHPIIGGAPPQIAWRYLETVANKVMPALGA
jgi:alkanesulfonate monooxygenase SsuD/methylene tetrahydromethanopterin reductase-like flavin-dependent oxidoreductase (luciferase family)